MSVKPLRTDLSWPSRPRRSMSASMSTSMPSSGTPNSAALLAIPDVTQPASAATSASAAVGAAAAPPPGGGGGGLGEERGGGGGVVGNEEEPARGGVQVVPQSVHRADFHERLRSPVPRGLNLHGAPAEGRVLAHHAVEFLHLLHVHVVELLRHGGLLVRRVKPARCCE